MPIVDQGISLLMVSTMVLRISDFQSGRIACVRISCRRSVKRSFLVVSSSRMLSILSPSSVSLRPSKLTADSSGLSGFALGCCSPYLSKIRLPSMRYLRNMGADRLGRASNVKP